MENISKYNLALALDNYSEKSQILDLIDSTKEYIGVSKIGFEQFIRFGPEIIEIVRETGNKIFLDLKLHDIPNTVAKAVLAASKHNVDFLTIHACGGKNMLEAAVDAARKSNKPPKLIGVTVLTSIDKLTLNNELNVQGTINSQVSHLARLAISTGLDGIVCSAADLPAIKNYIPETLEVVTPGIRMADDSCQDQKRIATPNQAVINGATLLVIGRAVTVSQNPEEKARKILNSIL